MVILGSPFREWRLDIGIGFGSSIHHPSIRLALDLQKTINRRGRLQLRNRDPVRPSLPFPFAADRLRSGPNDLAG